MRTKRPGNRRLRPSVTHLSVLDRELTEFQKNLIIDICHGTMNFLELDHVTLTTSLNRLAGEYLIEKVWRQGEKICPIITPRGRLFVKGFLLGG